MTAELVEPGTWQPRRWWWLVLLVFGLQLGLIFWLGESAPPRSQAPRFVPMLRLAGNSTNLLLVLNDPTLFALPHQEGFSGPAWLNLKYQPILPSGAPQEALLLALPARQLAADFSRFIETNFSDFLHTPAMSTPDLELPRLQETELTSKPSTLVIEGELAGRRLTTSKELPAWHCAELLTNSVVQLIIDGQGWPRSVVLLVASGFKPADDEALSRARSARFEPLPGITGPERAVDALKNLAWGQLVFQWQTLASTNGP
jgi:hypothetical protein